MSTLDGTQHAPDVAEQPGTSVELRIGGMTCASCATRIENKLNRMPRVSASVNYATDNAWVALPEGTSVADAIATVEATGYTAHPPEPSHAVPAEGTTVDAAAANGEVAALRRRLQISGVLATPVLLLAMTAPLQFDNWQWLSLTLAAPVVVWGAWPFHRAAWANAQKGRMIRSTGCFAPRPANPTSDHPLGKGCDLFPGTAGRFASGTDLDNGWRAAGWFRTNADALQVSYIIWQGRIWTPGRPDTDGWGQNYTGGGVYDPTDAVGGHYDHLHVSFRS